MLKPRSARVDVEPMGTALSKRERGRLAELEAVVERGLDRAREGFAEAGHALAAIRDGRLYKETHRSFDAYCRETWGFSRQRADQLVKWAEVTTVVVRAGLPAPENERQVRELVPLLGDPEALVETVRSRGYRSPKGGDNEWYTRPEFVEAAREVLGGIDLDPASNDRAQETVKAERYFTIEDDGLAQPWAGRVFMNPPYGRGKGGGKDFCEKLIHEYEAGVVDAAVVVLNAYSADTRWFRPFLDYPICVSTRPAFHHPDKAGDPMVWPAFVYLGPDPDAFVRVFSRFGPCLHDATRSDRTAFGRMMLDDEWELLRKEEEELFGTSKLPERDVVTEGVGWSLARLDEEWAVLRREETRIRSRDAASK